MPLDFYDRDGTPYAYSDDGETIYTFDGKPIAYVDGDSIYRFDGKHIGYFRSGIIRDDVGDALLFTNGARGGPMKPLKALKPLKGLKELKPLKGLKKLKPIRPLETLDWSQHEPVTIFEGDR